MFLEKQELYVTCASDSEALKVAVPDLYSFKNWIS